MYVTGTPHTLERRLHQFATSEADYDAYTAESLTISGELSANEETRLTREFEKKAATLDIE